MHAEHAPWYIISLFRPRAKSGSLKHVSGIPGHNPVFRYNNPGISGMVGKYAHEKLVKGRNYGTTPMVFRASKTKFKVTVNSLDFTRE